MIPNPDPTIKLGRNRPKFKSRNKDGARDTAMLLILLSKFPKIYRCSYPKGPEQDPEHESRSTMLLGKTD